MITFTGVDGNTRVFRGGTTTTSRFMASATSSPRGVSTFTTGMTSTITIVSENAAGTVTSTVPSVLPAGVTSITGSHPTYTVTYDITTRRQVIIPFTVSDGTDTITAMISVEVGYVPFFVAAGAEPTVLPTAPVEALTDHNQLSSLTQEEKTCT